MNKRQKPNKVDITDVDKKELLKELWKNSLTASFFTIHNINPPKLSEDELNKALKSEYIDYLCGRVIKCDLRKDYIDPAIMVR